jgi:hypothetical protein
MAKKHCEHCDAPMVEYKHGLSKGLARGLYRIASAGGGPINLNELNLNISQQTNFYKLRYWDLVKKSDTDSEKGGVWELTTKGWEFVKGAIWIPQTAVSYRGEFVRFEKGDIGITDITDGWKYRPDYARGSEPH